MKKLLGIFAHPDDESYMAAGTLAKYAKAGWKIDLVCATRGEDSARGSFTATDSDTFGGVRQKELELAASQIGASSITFLDYKDGKLSSQTPGDVEEKLMKVLRENKPDVVITMEPSGVTNHPDNVKLSLSTTFAFQKYAADRHEENPADENPPKLYYACMPDSIVSYFIKKKYFSGESFGKPWRGIDDKKITTVIDIKRQKGVKTKALLSYESKKEEMEAYIAIPHNPFLSQEYFILRYVGIVEAFMGKNDRVSDRL